MTRTRLIRATVAVFVTAQVLGILIHGFVLAADYRPYYGTLLRSMEGPPGWQVVLLPVAHLAVAIALVRIAMLKNGGTTWQRGIRLGVLGWLLGPAPMFLLWYAEQPWPGTLVIKQLPPELIGMLVLGTLAARFDS